MSEPAFTDKAGSTYRPYLTVAKVREIRRVTGIDLTRAGEAATILALGSDVWQLLDVLMIACDISDDATDGFLEGITGDVLEEATDALIAAIIAFFPSRQRLLMQKALARVRTAENQLIHQAAAKLESSETLGSSSPASPE